MQKLKKIQSGLTSDVMLKGLNVSPTLLHSLLLAPIRLMNKDATVLCRDRLFTLIYLLTLIYLSVSVCMYVRFLVSLCEC